MFSKNFFDGYKASLSILSSWYHASTTQGTAQRPRKHHAHGRIGMGDTQYTELTKKQAMFATLVSEGSTLADAYRKAYSPKTKRDKTIKDSASKVAKVPKVKARIKALKEEDRSVVVAHEKLTNEWLVDRLKTKAEDPNVSDASQIRALELLGKTTGLFDEGTKIIVEHRSEEEIEKEINERLEMFFGADA